MNYRKGRLLKWCLGESICLQRKIMPVLERKRGRVAWKQMAALYRQSLDKEGINYFSTPLSLLPNTEA